MIQRAAHTAASRRAGFTLMEVMIAVAILALMASLTYGSFSRSYDAKQDAQKVNERYHQIRQALTRMSTELAMAYITSADHRARQEEVRTKTIFKAEDERPVAWLTFSSLSHWILVEDAKESDQNEITYFGAQDPDDPHVTNLMRREDSRIDEEPEEGGRAYILCEDIAGLELEYWDSKEEEWVREWDTEDSDEYRGRLPSYVKITLTIKEDDIERKFVTKARINLTKAVDF